MPAYKDQQRGTWFVKFRYRDALGNTKQKKKTGFRTRKEALAFETSFLEMHSLSTDITTQTLAGRYLADSTLRLRETTMLTKNHIIQDILLPLLGNIPVSELTPAALRLLQNELLSTNYASSYLKLIWAELSAMMNYAVRYCGLRQNPCHLVEPISQQAAVRKMLMNSREKVESSPLSDKREFSASGGLSDGFLSSSDDQSDHLSSSEGEIQFWTLDEFNTFLTSQSGKPGFVAFSLLFWTGLRCGELLALTPADFNLREGTLTVHYSYQRINGRDVMTPPKTPKSRRTIYLPRFLADLTALYIFSMKLGKQDRLFPHTKYYLQYAMKTGCARTGVRRIRIHDLRHSHASLLIELGFSPLLISERLGHEKVETTLNIYSHLYPSKQRELAKVLDLVQMQGMDRAIAAAHRDFSPSITSHGTFPVPDPVNGN